MRRDKRRERNIAIYFGRKRASDCANQKPVSSDVPVFYSRRFQSRLELALARARVLRFVHKRRQHRRKHRQHKRHADRNKPVHIDKLHGFARVELLEYAVKNDGAHGQRQHYAEQNNRQKVILQAVPFFERRRNKYDGRGYDRYEYNKQIVVLAVILARRRHFRRTVKYSNLVG